MQKIQVLHAITKAWKTGCKILPWQSECVYYVDSERFTVKVYATTKIGAVSDAIDAAYRLAIKKAVV